MLNEVPSRKRLLNTLNPLVIVLAVMFLSVIRTSFIRVMPDFVVYWDILYPVALYLGQRRPLLEGFVLTLLLSHFYSLSSGAPMGVYAVQYIIIFAISRSISLVVYADSILMITSLLLGLYTFSRFTLPIVSASFGFSLPLFSLNTLHPLRLFLNYGTGFLSYWMLIHIDALTFKVPRSELNLDEGSL